ncbi:hypothetical protein [Candidatus Mycoplasma haematohominis]|uniref:Uncharacterized protein n=1 Tax=Candidatus Mycoplasma haematohominis TaxID=1494318 RepID=A0A478FSP9_9MOLU|nr:hypothetical protein [Candidatus Mycoplasma haemohominis]GCE63095.1 hypothetical protein MHSWG343_00730 [Candidatus Mycoplasma haemohominis]
MASPGEIAVGVSVATAVVGTGSVATYYAVNGIGKSQENAEVSQSKIVEPGTDSREQQPATGDTNGASGGSGSQAQGGGGDSAGQSREDTSTVPSGSTSGTQEGTSIGNPTGETESSKGEAATGEQAGSVPEASETSTDLTTSSSPTNTESQTSLATSGNGQTQTPAAQSN